MRVRILLILCVVLGLGAVAPAQLRDIPSLVLNKKSETIPKSIENFTVLSYESKGVSFYRIVGADNRAILLPDEGKHEIDLVFPNTYTEHAKYAWARPAVGSGNQQNVRNSGGANKTRIAFDAGFQELNVYNNGNSKAGFGGNLDVTKARRGGNGIFLQAELKKVDQIDLGPAQVGSQKRRDVINDVIPVIIRRFESEYEKYIALVADGWFTDNGDVQEMCDQAIAMNLSGSQIRQLDQELSGGFKPSGNGQHQCNDRCPTPCDRVNGSVVRDQGRGEVDRDSDSTKRSSKSQVILTSVIEMSYNGELVNDQGTVRFENGKVLSIKSKDGQPFDFAFIQVFPDGSEKVSAVRKQKTSTKLNLNLAYQSYRVEVTRNNRLIGMIMLEAK